ncbi:phytanoyl-CoA dioxygenase family protein [Paenibacillus sp. J2TS4]|uniref:phytanoyl-CoA dioxygenase family protein n=1 Tax=Paenibacillus sp. J2TS4 TaxID=2807194 RepID=UPI001B2D152E|nr:phytanoyl-CoA dioxygenase family protein [Paenibacillus sp. J2TS4]GIP31518.1 protein involved in biosynthesis of mitomycin antibiotics/polyketide fumonisin [Paenibacillus sp. J2TS4]
MNRTWPGHKQQFDLEGYTIVKGLLSGAQVEEIKETFMGIHREGPIPGYFHPVAAAEAAEDILKQYPRVMHPHRFHETAKRYMLHPGVFDVLAQLLEEEPIAAQSMFYFKPPGAKGQALHQDNFYLKVEPGTCIAAWMAIDPSDEENGGIMLVPKSNSLDIECPHLADPTVSFTKEEVTVPDGMKIVSTRLEAGDVLFFNGSVIHGSYPNRSPDRFRRSFICHYTGISARRIGQYYNPLYTRNGQHLELEWNEDAGPCGSEFEQPAEAH